MPVFVVATTADADRIPLSVQSCFKHYISIEVCLLMEQSAIQLHILQAPDEEERLQILRELLSDSPLALDVKIESIATQTAALVAADLVDLAVRVQTAAVDRITDAR
jgi:peroxin-6